MNYTSYNKKAISPVVATALILVVAVVSVVGFQGWFTSFQSSQLVDVESQTSVISQGGSVELLQVIGSQVYIKNDKVDNYDNFTLKIEGNDCSISSLALGVEKYDISSCIENSSGATDIVLITENKLDEKIFLVENSVSAAPPAPADIIPDAFTFPTYFAMGWDTQVSNLVTLGGFDGSLPVNVMSEESDVVLRINGGSWVTSSTAVAGDNLELRVTSTTCMKNADVNVTLGSFSTVWIYNEAC